MPTVWLSNVQLEPYPRGEVMEPRPLELLKRKGWSRLQVGAAGGAIRQDSGERVTWAPFACIVDREVYGFGARGDGPLACLGTAEAAFGHPDCLVVQPRRRTRRGDLGGLNYEVASQAAVGFVRARVAESWPGALVVDGSDDWTAPEHVRVFDLLRGWGIRPQAWWHTGISGFTPSGAILRGPALEMFVARYGATFGREPWELGPEDEVPTGERPPCGCYRGEGLLVT